jgi:hypothetical protein
MYSRYSSMRPWAWSVWASPRAAVYLDLACVLLLELGHLARVVAADDRGRLPVGGLQCRRDHVLGQGVEPRRYRIVLVGKVWPAGGEDLEGAAPKEDGLGLGEHIADDLAHVLAEAGEAPAAVLETVVAVLVGPAGCLHNPVEGLECRDGEGAHASAPFLA